MMPPWLHDTLADLRTALRTMRRTPVFALLVVSTLALGIGGAVTVWTLIDGVVLRPLVYPAADRLYTVTEATPQGDRRPVSYPTFLDWKARVTALDRLAFARGDELILDHPEGARRIIAAYVTGDFFPALGVSPLAGRTFGDDDGTEHPVVISWETWQHFFAGAPDAIGKTLRTKSGVFTVTGVMPRAFNEPRWAHVWLPINALPATARFVLTQRSLHVDSQLTARLAPGVTLAAAQTQLAAIASAIAAEHPDDAANWTRADFTTLRENLVGDAGTRLRVLGAVVALVLLVTCLNAAGLLVARHAARSRELAVRTALGAQRTRLIRQLLAESAALAAAGGVAGLLVASGALFALRTWAPFLFPRLAEVQVDGRAAAFALATVGLVTLLLALLPARIALRLELTAALRHGTGGSGEGRGQTRLRGALVVAQVALALVVTVSAALLARTLTRLGDVSLGLDPRDVITFRVALPDQYAEPHAALDLYRRLQEGINAVPGVSAVALANHLPFGAGLMTTRVVTSAPPAGDGSDQAVFRTVSPEYLSVLGGTLLRGRFVDADDLRSVGSGLVVNEAFVRRFAGDRDPIGMPVTVFRMAQGRADMGTPISAPIVGVIADERISGPEADPFPIVYVPYTWNAWPSIYLAIRTTLPPATIVPALTRAVIATDPAIPVAGASSESNFFPMPVLLEGTLQQRRLSAWSFSAFSIITLGLAVVGIFGVMAYVVVQRSREIGLRLALGATPSAVSRWVLWQSVRLAAAGIVIGVAGALASMRFLRTQLVGVAPTDPVVYVGVAIVFAVAAVAAGVVPAWRAARIDPAMMLRAE